MNETQQEDWLDRQLRECAPYIDDAGFTARVLVKLPPPAQKRVSLRAVIILGLTILGCVLAYVLSDGGRFITVNVIRLTTLPTLWLLALAIASGRLVSAGGMVAAISKSRELQS
jgi:hypothetical protein